MDNLLTYAKYAALDAYQSAVLLHRTGHMPWQELNVVAESFAAISRAHDRLELARSRRGVVGPITIDTTNLVAFRAPKRKRREAKAAQH